MSAKHAARFLTVAVLLLLDRPSPVNGAEAAQKSAETDPVAAISAKEIQRREEDRAKALSEIDKGGKMSGLRQYEGAVKCYGTALSLLPQTPFAEKDRRIALQGFTDASLQLAEQRVSEGYARSRPGQAVASAEDVIDNILIFSPQNKAALRFKARLGSPDFFNSAITPEFRVEIEKVKTYLREGEDFFKTARFDLAIKRADQVLAIDPYNSAARKLQEEANRAISTAAASGYNEARSRALRDVEKAWSNPVRRFGNVQLSATERQMLDPSQTEKLRLKVQKIILPEIQFTDAPIFQVADILTKATQAVDTGENNTGVLIIANFPATAPAAHASSKTSILDLAPPPQTERGSGELTVRTPKFPAGFRLAEILDMISSLAGIKWVVKENRVELVPKTTPTDVLVTRKWTVSPFLFSSSSSAPRVDDLASTGLGAALGGGAPQNSGGPKSVSRRRIDPKEFLSGMNVSFDVSGSTATYNPRSRELTVINTIQMLELVDSIVADSEGQAPVQVDIHAKFIEFTQLNTKELSFDWLLGVAKLQDHNQILTTGGGAGPQSLATFKDAGTAQNLPNGGFPLTGANRSGQSALSLNGLDRLLSSGLPGSSAASSAALAVMGLTSPQFQTLIHAVNQRKDIDLLSSPSITARDQEEATIDIVREFLYPTQFTPPQIPQTIGSTSGTAGGQAPSVPVTPTTPSGFEKRDTGVKLRVTPAIKGDNYAIDLELHPEVTEFEGFINYGSPIQTVATGGNVALSRPEPIVLTENVINQPIFSVRKIHTTVTLLDGETIALGGLIREDVQKVNDKVPVLGDIPLVGRLFRSKVDQHIKKNLTIFVSARIIDASGQPLKSTKAELETEEVPSLTGSKSLGLIR